MSMKGKGKIEPLPSPDFIRFTQEGIVPIRGYIVNKDTGNVFGGNSLAADYTLRSVRDYIKSGEANIESFPIGNILTFTRGYKNKDNAIQVYCFEDDGWKHDSENIESFILRNGIYSLTDSIRIHKKQEILNAELEHRYKTPSKEIYFESGPDLSDLGIDLIDVKII